MSANDINTYLTEPLVNISEKVLSSVKSIFNTRVSNQIKQSDYFSRDLSWIQFNYRVLDQALNPKRTLFERMRFLGITASNFDEFFMIRVGSLYNYLDYNKERIDYSGLREKPFKTALFAEAQAFYKAQYQCFEQQLKPLFSDAGFQIADINSLKEEEKEEVYQYFKKTIYPMLTPMMLDVYHTFPVIMSKTLTIAVITQIKDDNKNPKRLTFVQIPQNVPRFYEIERDDHVLFLPIEDIVKWQIDKLFRNVDIVSIDLFRIIRNGDVSVDESDDIELDFVDEVRRKLSRRKTGRVVRVELADNYNPLLHKILKERWDLENDNFFTATSMLDFTWLSQIIQHRDFQAEAPTPPQPIQPLSLTGDEAQDIFELLKTRDLLMHHPYNSMEPLIQLIEQAADDPNVLSIKMTIYRLAKDSRIVSALLKAAENGKFVSVLFEVKARFDEENNIKEAKRLQKAGCFVIYGVGSLKTHCKMMLIVRKEEDKVTRYVHLSSGNYNEMTSRFYTDISLLTTNEVYANDVSEFFNVITGHSNPDAYQYLITAPREMRQRLLDLISNEANNAREGKEAGIVIKINSLEDRVIIDELYRASNAGVKIYLIVRGICCLRPQREGLSQNISVKSMVGDYLEHARILYFHNAGAPLIFGGSADMMNRSFDRRVESLFQIVDTRLQAEVMNILQLNLADTANSYFLNEEGDYIKIDTRGKKAMNAQKEFFKLTPEVLEQGNVLLPYLQVTK